MDIIDLKKKSKSFQILKSQWHSVLGIQRATPKKGFLFYHRKNCPNSSHIKPERDLWLMLIRSTGKTVDLPVIILWYQSRYQ